MAEYSEYDCRYAYKAFQEKSRILYIVHENVFKLASVEDNKVSFDGEEIVLSNKKYKEIGQIDDEK